VILGGGFGGIAAAHRLKERLREDVDVTLIDRRATFMMGLRILSVLVAQADRASGTRPLERLARKHVRYVRGEVTGIDPARKTVTTTVGRFDCDALIVSLGAELRPDLVPGFDPAGANLYDPEQAEAIAARIAGIDRGRIGIGILGVPYKCPPAPYEAAFLIDEALRKRGVRDRIELEVFTPQPSSLPVAGPAACAAVDSRMASRSIQFLPGRKVVAVDGRDVVFENERRSYDVFLGVAPHRAPAVVKASGLARGEWIRPRRDTCEITEGSNVFAIGDVTEMPLANGMMLPKAGVFAEAQGRVAADVIADRNGSGPAGRFDGYGYCYFEVGDGEATAVRGRFFTEPEPDIEVAEPSPQGLEEKRRFEVTRLEAWF
jgi:sulfide:quinone oxidoreductase